MPPAPDMTGRTLAGIGWTGAATAIQVALQFGVQLVLARLLDPSDFGLVAAAMVVVGFAQYFWQLGIGPALVQRAELTLEHIEVGFTTAVLMGGLLGAGLLLAAEPIESAFGIDGLAPIVRGMVLVYVLAGIALVAESLLRRELRFKAVAGAQLTSYVVYVCVAVPAAALGAGAWALVGGQIAQRFAYAAVVLRLRRHAKRLRLSLSPLRDLLSYGSRQTAGQIGNFFALQGDNIAVGRVLGAAPLGLYGRAYNLMMLPAFVFGQVVDTVLFAAMSQVQTEPDRLARAYRRSMAVAALVGLPLGALIAVLAPEIITVAFGSRWAEAAPVLRLLAGGLYFRLAYKLGGSVANAVGAPGAVARAQWVYAALVLGGAFVGGATVGLEGVAIAVVAALAVVFVLLTRLGLSLSGTAVGALLAGLRPALGATCVVAAASLAVAEAARSAQLPSPAVLLLGSAVPFAAVAVIAAVRPAWVLGEDGAHVLGEARRRIDAIRERRRSGG